MAQTPQLPENASSVQQSPGKATATEPSRRARHRQVHEVTFVTYPKLLFVWPVILLGLVFYPLGYPQPAPPPAEVVAAGPGQPAEAPASGRLEVLGWIYLWAIVLVLLTLGVDVDRNKAVFFVVLAGGIYVLGLWLHDTKGFTLFGQIFRWFANLDVQYDRRLGLTLSVILLVPYVLMLLWARFNDRWRITHNEFEHYSLGKVSDSLGRGAKTIRTEFPDVFELLLGLAGTLIVYNATGTQELRRIPHVTFLPLVRKRLDKILEKTAITAAQTEEEEDEN